MYTCLILQNNELLNQHSAVLEDLKFTREISDWKWIKNLKSTSLLLVTYTIYSYLISNRTVCQCELKYHVQNIDNLLLGRKLYKYILRSSLNSILQLYTTTLYYTWDRTSGFLREDVVCILYTRHFTASFIDSIRVRTCHFYYSSGNNWELCCCFHRSGPFCL